MIERHGGFQRHALRRRMIGPSVGLGDQFFKFGDIKGIGSIGPPLHRLCVHV